MAEPFSSTTATIVRRNRWVLGFASLMALGALVALVFGSDSLSTMLLVDSVVLAVVSIVANPWPRDEEAHVEADADGVRVNGVIEAPQARIRGGFVVPDVGRGPKVRIEQRMELPLEVRVRDEDEGRAMLRALGLDATQRAVTFDLPPRAMSDRKTSITTLLYFGVIFFLVGVLGPMLRTSAAIVVLPAMGLVLAHFILARTALTVGSDGLLLSRLGQRRFWRYDDNQKVDVFTDESIFNPAWEGIRLRLRSGEEVKIPVSQRRTRRAEKLDRILQRVREAMESHQKGDPAADAALLGRGKRDVGDWIQSLRAMGSGAAADHRTAPVPPERLWRIVEDPRATPEARAGAAVALGVSTDEEGRTRLATVAKAVAAPRLRIALEAAASEDEEALREALSVVEEPKESARKK